MVRYLLEQGADRDKAGNFSYVEGGCLYDRQGTPLLCAVWRDHLEIAMLLMSYGADLNARDNFDMLPIDVAKCNEKMKQAIRDEPRRRMDHGHKRATEQDRHPNACTSASAQEEDDEEDEKEEEKEQSNKRPRLDQGAAEAEEGKVAEEDEDSEPSSDEEADD